VVKEEMVVVAKGKLLKSRLPRRSEKRKALDVKSAGTQHRHPRGSVDQWISGGRRSHGGAEARRKQREEPTTRHKGQLACPMLLPVPVC
jgi:hypothetical protein